MFIISKISKPGLLASPNLPHFVYQRNSVKWFLGALGKIVECKCIVASGSPFPRVNSPGHRDPMACFPVPSYAPKLEACFTSFSLLHHTEILLS